MYVLLPSKSINIGGWHGLDGESLPSNLQWEGWWGDLPVLSGNIPGTKFNYAIEINTNSTKTDLTIGLDGGYIRYVTGRPGYDGTIYPTWGPNELETGIVCCKWYQGFITKDGLSNPSRTIDISKSGDYGTISAFTVKIRNNELYWKKLLDNKISLINKPIRVFAIINDVFYQIWSGVVQETPRTADEYIIKCSDSSVSIHKDLPNEGLAVTLGDVGYVKATRIGESSHIRLSQNSISAPIYDYSVSTAITPISGSLDTFTNWKLDLLTNGVNFTENELSGKYLKISRFRYNESVDSESKSVLDSELLYIYKSDTSFASGIYNITSVYTKQAPLTNPPINDSNTLNYYTYKGNLLLTVYLYDFVCWVECIDINATYSLAQSGFVPDLSEVYQYNRDRDEYIKVPVNAIDNENGTFSIASPFNLEGEEIPFYQPLKFDIAAYDVFPITSGIHTFGASAIFTETVINNQEIYNGTLTIPPSLTGHFSGGQFNAFLYATSSDSSNFIWCNISGTASNPVSSGINTVYNFTAKPNPDRIRVVSDPTKNLYYHLALHFTEESYDTFKSKVTDLEIMNPSNYVQYKNVTASGSMFRPVITIQDKITSDDDLYIMADYAISNPFKNAQFRLRWYGIDKFGRMIIPDSEGNDIGVGILYSYKSTSSLPYFFFGLPESYYRSNFRSAPSLENYSFIPVLYNWYENGGILIPNPSVAGDYIPSGWDSAFGKDLFKVPDNLKNMLIAEQIVAIWPMFEVRMETASNYDFTILEIGVLARRTQSITNELYVKPKEVYGDVPTNSVYGMFKYILEENDGITSSNIRYGNLPLVRSEWQTGRQFAEVKNSKEYLKELTRHSYTALYPDRLGRRAFNCWLDNSGSSSNHDDSFVVRGSIDEFNTTPISDVYNVFNFEYDYDYGKNEYRRGIIVKNTDKDSFPVSDWTSYVSGIYDYDIAKGIWETARSGYLLTGTNYSPADGYNQLPYYIDASTDRNSPVYYLINMVNWTSRQKYDVSYNIPITAETINTELTERVSIANSQFTNNDSYSGYITSITYDLKNDQIKIGTLIEPPDGFVHYVLPDVPVETYLVIDAQNLVDRSSYTIYDADYREE